MGPEFKQPNIENSGEIIKSIEIPREEFKCLGDVTNFVSQLSKEEHQYFDGPIGYLAGANDEIEEIFQKKKSQLGEESLLGKERHDFIFKAKRGAEYEVCKDVVDYKNNQLRKLIEFIEKQEIWKTKFSTASNINYSRHIFPDFNSFVKGLENSEEYHKMNSFAGQNLNSIYFISNSGLSLRIKMKDLHPNGNIVKSLQPSGELSICIDEITNPDYDKKSTKNSEEFPNEIVSFEPKLGYRVEEFCTNDFFSNRDSDFKSKIKVLKNKDKIIIEGFDGNHAGHYINKIYF